jgi:phosphoribosylanthranilate isomerase
MKIKVCGLRDVDNINAVANLAPGYMGFIFYDGSPRFAKNLNAGALKALPSAIITTAVFVDEDAEKIGALIDEFNFDAIQLHGNENPAFCETFKGKVKVLKAFGLHDGFDFKQLEPYAGKVDFFLFDTKTDIHGGSGKAFNWDILDKYKLDTPFFLSGGISLDNLAAIKEVTHPMFYGIDLNSRFETAPGIKNIAMLAQAFDIIKQFDTDEVRG